jgi:hypothetical protein
MSDNGNWSDDSDSGTPLPPKLQEFSDNMMETAADFDVASSIFGERSGSKATKGKGNMARASRATATPTPSAMSRGTTPLSYASSSPLSAASQGSLTPRSTPAPVVRSLPQKALLERIHNAVGTFKSCRNDPQTMQFFGQFADEVLQFIFIFFFFFWINGMYFNMDLWGELNRSPAFTYTWPFSYTKVLIYVS